MVVAIPVTEGTKSIHLFLELPVIDIILEAKFDSSPFRDVRISFVGNNLQKFGSEIRDSEIRIGTKHLSKAPLIIDSLNVQRI